MVNFVFHHLFNYREFSSFLQGGIISLSIPVFTDQSPELFGFPFKTKVNCARLTGDAVTSKTIGGGAFIFLSQRRCRSEMQSHSFEEKM